MGVYAGVTNSWINISPSNSLSGIVTSGLVLALNAGRTLSYVGSGTTWTDLSGNGNTGTLTNGPTYSSANGGSIVFDGVDDYVSTPNFNFSTESFTVEFWFKFNSIPNNFIALIAGTTANTQLFITTKSNGQGIRFGLTGVAEYASGTQTWSTGTWYHVVLIRNGSDIKFYVNTNNITDGTFTNSTSYNGTFLIGATAGAINLNGNIAQASIYNRALSAIEVSQNFNALRSRFGI
jgi:hypothetical protein